MRHLLGVADLSAAEIEHLLVLTDSFVEVSRRRMPKVPALQGRTVTWLFYEDSTRTRLSFEQAAKRLSADTLSFSVSSSSVNKGESLRDTVETIEAMGVDAIVVRHRSAGVPHQVARWVSASVINAGDGWHEHPTQALLDCYTIREHLGGLDGRHVAIVGDVKHSRVARSDAWAFSTLGAEVTLVAPPTLLPPSTEGWPVRVSHDLDAVLPAVDAVYLLRMQQERMTEALIPSLREYTATYGLTRRRVDLLDEKAIVMHPGPDEPGRRDRGGRRRPAPLGRRRPGAQRGGRPHGGAVRPARLRPRPPRRPMKSLAIRGGTVVDATGERRADVLVEDGRIAAVVPAAEAADLRADLDLDAGGCVVAPGLVDLHTHLRQPGREEAETVETGARAAALGGYTCVLAMPNTTPAIDSAGVAREVLDLGRGACCEVRTSAAITVGRAGERLTPMAELAALGVRFFTDDGDGVQDGRLMRRALEYARGLGVTLAQHCEDKVLAAGGAMNEGAVVGPPGRPRPAGRGRGGHGDAGHRPGPPHGRPGPLPTPLDRPVGGAGGGGQGRGPGGHVRGDAPPPDADRRALRRLRPGVQGQPPAAHGEGRRGAAGRAGGGDRRLHRHRPRPPRARGQGAALRPGAPRACWGWRPRWPWR